MGLVFPLVAGPLVSGLLLAIPCVPPFLGSLLFECDPNGFWLDSYAPWEIVVAGIHSVLTTCWFIFASQIPIFYVFCLFPVTVVSIRNHLQKIKK